jgi:hypothetical protein
MRDGSAGPTTSTRNPLRREEAGRGACPPPANWLVGHSCQPARSRESSPIDNHDQELSERAGQRPVDDDCLSLGGVPGDTGEGHVRDNQHVILKAHASAAAGAKDQNDSLNWDRQTEYARHVDANGHGRAIERRCSRGPGLWGATQRAVEDGAGHRAGDGHARGESRRRDGESRRCDRKSRRRDKRLRCSPSTGCQTGHQCEPRLGSLCAGIRPNTRIARSRPTPIQSI